MNNEITITREEYIDLLTYKIISDALSQSLLHECYLGSDKELHCYNLENTLQLFKTFYKYDYEEKVKELLSEEINWFS